jgi:hypothetical protein
MLTSISLEVPPTLVREPAGRAISVAPTTVIWVSSCAEQSVLSLGTFVCVNAALDPRQTPAPASSSAGNVVTYSAA